MCDNRDIWIEWILFILKGVEQTAKETIILINSLKAVLRHLWMTLRLSCEVS